MDLLLPVLLLALAVWAFRRLRTSVTTSAERRRRALLPGYTPDLPIVLKSARVLEEAKDAARCTCGGRVLQLGETSRMGLRVARGQCVECEADVDLYFVLPHLVN